ncbi:MAG: MerR family transcriptional regulator [Nitrospinae bacterium]|nr:MerR family transcriptional regulator [Nitrospinota bacterium]
MTLNDLAKRTNLATSTLHRYVRLGLIPQQRSGRFGYRLFDEEAIAYVEIIRTLTRRGKSLAEIRGILQRVPISELLSAVKPPHAALLKDRGGSSPPVRGTTASPSTQAGVPMSGSPQWKRSIGSYTNKELRALKFHSVTEVDRAIDRCWEDPNLQGVPRATPDGRTLIVPEEAVRYFQAEGLKFTVSTLLNREELTPEKLAETRRKYGM